MRRFGCVVMVGMLGCEPEATIDPPVAPGIPVVAFEDSCEAAGKVAEPGVQTLDDTHALVYGSQGGVHADIVLQVQGISPGAAAVRGYSPEELGWPMVIHELHDAAEEAPGYATVYPVEVVGTSLEGTITLRVYEPNSQGDELALTVLVEDVCGHAVEAVLPVAFE